MSNICTEMDGLEILAWSSDIHTTLRRSFLWIALLRIASRRTTQLSLHGGSRLGRLYTLHYFHFGGPEKGFLLAVWQAIWKSRLVVAGAKWENMMLDYIHSVSVSTYLGQERRSSRCCIATNSLHIVLVLAASICGT